MSVLSDKINALEDIPEQWAKKIDKFQPKMFKRLTKLLSTLTLTGEGFVEMTAENLQKIDTILVGLKDYLTTGEYVSIVEDLNKQFLAQEANTIAYFETTFGSAPVTSFGSTLYNVQRANMIEAVIGKGLDELLSTPLRNTLIEGIASGSSYSDLLTNVQRISMGNEKLEGHLLRYSRQIVSDTLATTDRQFTQIVGDELGLEWYRYLGGKMKTTRCFCLERNGGFYHRKEVEGWGNMIGIGNCNVDGGWAGMYKGTNSETIFTWVGGYNCQHSLLPISEVGVPKKDLLNAMEKGWYNPSQAVRNELGL